MHLKRLLGLLPKLNHMPLRKMNFTAIGKQLIFEWVFLSLTDQAR
jgi:hypothetical protein